LFFEIVMALEGEEETYLDESGDGNPKVTEEDSISGDEEAPTKVNLKFSYYYKLLLFS